jgi:EmrB/QacA subfamily drug resistance transporter
LTSNSVARVPDSIDRSLRNVALLVAACFFMENLDGTIVTTAAPRIGRALHVPATSVGLVIAAYLVTLAVLIPLSGWLSGRYGPRPIFLTAIALFTVASLACALSSSLAALVACRIVQGVGGAMMVPVGRLVVLSRTAKSDMLRIVSLLVWPALVAPIIAPLAGGVIVTYASWRWLFLINLPLGAIAFAVAWRLIRQPALEAPAPLDLAGVLLTGAGLAAATYMAQLFSQPALHTSAAVVLAVAAAGLLTAAVVHLDRAAHPLINLRTLRVPTFRTAIGSGSLFYMSLSAVPFVLTLMFQQRFDFSPVKSGALVLFVFIGNIAIKPATTPLLRRFGFRPVLVATTVGAAVTLTVIGLFTAATSLALVAAVVLASGVFRSVGMTCYTTIAFADTPPEQIRDANTLQATAQQLSIGLGVPLGAVAIRAGRPLARLVSGGTGVGGAYTAAFAALAAIVLLATAGALRLRPEAGDAVSRRPAREARNPRDSADCSPSRPPGRNNIDV